MDEEQKNNTSENTGAEEQNRGVNGVTITSLSGMYQDWFLDYASYVILERAVPHVYDGLKPVQRRILHAMKQLDDGRYNKVANIIGHAMQYHPHGDASIGDALVQLGQKELLIDAQGNWGNVLTGDSAAASRYIEARLSKFASEVIFNPKTTFWKPSYDGRNKEPISLPVKFPLLLAQGVEGIAVGLASKILPHNFNELIDACIATLKDEDFELYPDFLTGGMIDVSKYNDGLRGGRVRVRAHIEKQDKRTLVITDIPFGETTSSVIDSIILANEKGKIKVKHIDDNTSEFVEILVHLPNNVSPDKTIDALYAFTKCEVPISPNSCVIEEDKPRFVGVKEMLQLSVYNTMELLKQELLIKQKELEEQWHFASLEKWFIENRIYKDKGYENAKSTEAAIEFIDSKLDSERNKFIREITQDDLLKLLEIKMKRILKFNVDSADELMRSIEGEIEEIKHNLNHLVIYTITYYKNIKLKYGKGRERKTEIRNFDNIDTTKVAVANEKLYVDRKEGFVGTSLKKDEFVCECSDIDDIIVFKRDGTYSVNKVSEKAFFGKDIIHVNVFKKNDKRTIFNVVYRDGKAGYAMVKRFAVTSITRDKEYNLTKGTKDSKVLYFSANPNGEAEIIKVYLKPRPKIRRLIFEYDLKEVIIKGRDSNGNILSKNDVHKITLKEEGVSTLGGRKIWFDDVVMRLNAEGRGKLLGEFQGSDKILIMRQDGVYRLTSFELTNHYEGNILVIEKYQPNKIWTAIHYDSNQDYYYLKRFTAEENSTEQSFISEDPGSKLIALSEDKFPQVKIKFGGKHKDREPELVDAEEFISVKSYKARGKRLTSLDVNTIAFDTPLDKQVEEDIGTENPGKDQEDSSPSNGNNSDDKDNPTQMSLEL
jgi:topoisomerase-4 subunit A